MSKKWTAQLTLTRAELVEMERVLLEAEPCGKRRFATQEQIRAKIDALFRGNDPIEVVTL